MASRGYLGEFELLVMLAIVRLRDGAYGVPIARMIEEETGREAAMGSVYATLERLEEKGFVSSRLGDATPERGGKAKRYFFPTGQGIARIRETRQALTRLWRGLPRWKRAIA